MPQPEVGILAIQLNVLHILNSDALVIELFQWCIIYQATVKGKFKMCYILNVEYLRVYVVVKSLTSQDKLHKTS